MPDYSLGKIYKIVNSENGKLYIGSTTQILSARISGHRKHARGDGRLSRLYKAMRKIGIDKFKIKLIKEYPCSSQKELEKEEFRIIQKMIKKEITLYNAVTEFRTLPESVRKSMSKAQLKRGNVCFELEQNRWRFQWYPVPSGNQKSKSFSVNKYGDKEAKAMAIALQDLTYPKISQV
jgi:hypothetical protein